MTPIPLAGMTDSAVKNEEGHMDRPLKSAPPYAVASVDNALRLAAILQLEGALTVTEVAERLRVARSTAHRLLAMLVYRDFAVQDDERVYHPGPVLELAAHSQSRTSRLRATALPHLRRLVDAVDESANLSIRTGDTVRFIASIECAQALRVGSREGMVFPAHLTSGGLLLLAELPPVALNEVYDEARYVERPDDRPDLGRLRVELRRVRRAGFALNHGRSERGVTAVGVPVRARDGSTLACLSVSMPSVRYDRHRLPELVAILRRVASTIEIDVAGERT